MEEFLDQRINAELEMCKPRYWINEFYNDHPFIFWLIALLIGAAVTLVSG